MTERNTLNMRFFPVVFPLAAACGAALIAGCGSSGGTTDTARVRAFNASPNGGAATISINGSAVSGSQAFAVGSAYQYLGSGLSTGTLSLSAAPGAAYSAASQNFSANNFYSLIAVGRADVTTPTDPRYPALLVTSDNLTTPLNNQSSVRIIQAAPDAGAVDVLVNGAVVSSAAAYKNVGVYTNVSSGTAKIQINQAGTNTILAGPQAISVSAGHVYTVIVEEPTVTPTPTFSIQGIDDTGAV